MSGCILQKKAPNNIFIFKLKNFTPRVNIWSSNLTRKNKISQKVKIDTNHSNSDFIGGGIFWEGGSNSGGIILRPMETLVFATIIMFLTLLVRGVCKIHHVGTSETIKCVGSNS